MKVIYKIILFSILIVFFSQCKKEQKKNTLNVKPKLIQSIEKQFVIDSSFVIGDCRRYGIFPDSIPSKKKLNLYDIRLKKLLELSETQNLKIFFQKGYYPLNLNILSNRNVQLHFQNSEFNTLRITDERGDKSKNIVITGKLTLYDKFSSFNVENIVIDSLIIKTDTIKNLTKKRSRGFHIYKATKNLKLNYLQIDDLGSGIEKYYKNAHAALTIDGRPENITIKSVKIHSSDRHGAYITGENIKIDRIEINNFAQGNTNGMTGMIDLTKGKETKLTGFWINHCNDCVIDTLILDNTTKKGFYSLQLDQGIYSKPSFINNISLRSYSKTLPIEDDILTNVLVKNEF
jgi:hypothetical protein